MTTIDYAFIKDNKVVNIAVFDDPTEELLQKFKEESNVDLLISLKDKKVILGSTWDGQDFIDPKPYESWILNSHKKWESPVPYPEDDKSYYWDESSISWKVYTSLT